MKRWAHVLSVALLFTVGISAVVAQSLRIPIQVDAGYGGVSRTLVLGVDTAATFCTDPDLGEQQVAPPPPGGVFDARFIWPRPGNGATCFDQGMFVDLRPFISTTQIDTYKISIQQYQDWHGPLYHARISWPNLNAYYTNSVWLKRTYPPMTINMKTDTTYLLTDDDSDPARFFIVTGDPSYVPLPPIVTTGSSGQLTPTSAAISGTISPNGFSTTGWFEWGTTTSYGNSTTTQSLGSGEGFVGLNATLPGLVTGTTYHYRAIAQNANGTTHGADMTITTIPDPVAMATMFPIRIGIGSSYFIRLWVGVDSSATFCIDPALGENFLPPSPPGGIFDARLVYPRNGNGGMCFDQGTLKDFRPYAGSSQVDTFKIKFQSDYYNSPITFSWPSIAVYFNDSVKLVDRYGGLAVNVDMKAETSFTLTSGDAYFNSLLVVAGTMPANRAPAVMTNPPGSIVYTSAQFDGIANPNGFAATGWFEWGLDANYGNTTPIQSLGNGANVIPIAEAVSGLYPGTTYHYRVVAQNGNGTTEGPDRTFRTEGVTSQYSMATGWNMISLPVTVGDARKTTLFPAAQSLASTYVYGQGFVPRDTLRMGEGYWVKFGTAHSDSVTGAPVTQDTFNIKAGWNMIGSITSSTDISSIIQIPSGIVQSPFFGFSGGYAAAATLAPGKAYWVKSSVNGQLVISSASGRPAGPAKSQTLRK